MTVGARTYVDSIYPYVIESSAGSCAVNWMSLSVRKRIRNKTHKTTNESNPTTSDCPHCLQFKWIQIISVLYTGIKIQNRGIQQHKN